MIFLSSRIIVTIMYLTDSNFGWVAGWLLRWAVNAVPVSDFNRVNCASWNEFIGQASIRDVTATSCDVRPSRWSGPPAGAGQDPLTGAPPLRGGRSKTTSPQQDKALSFSVLPEILRRPFYRLSLKACETFWYLFEVRKGESACVPWTMDVWLHGFSWTISWKPKDCVSYDFSQA